MMIRWGCAYADMRFDADDYAREGLVERVNAFTDFWGTRGYRVNMDVVALLVRKNVRTAWRTASCPHALPS